MRAGRRLKKTTVKDLRTFAAGGYLRGYRGGCDGFTLTELLIVLAILGLLIAFVVPVHNRTVRVARRAICATNLRALSAGWADLDASMKLSQDKYEGTLGASWTGLVFPHISYSTEALLCPEADPKHIPIAPKFCKKNWGHIQWDFFNFDPVWESTPYASLYNAGQVPTMWKLNDEDYQTWLANSHVGWGVMDHNKDWLPQYTPGKDPKSYWIVFEDGGQEWAGANGGGHDYRDYAVYVREEGPNTYNFTFYEFGSSDANHGVVDANGLEVWIEEGSGDRYGGVGPYYFSDPATNYGMNADRPKQTSDSVFILDYETHVCKPNAAPDADDAFERNIAPRHLGRCNVLLANGSVRAMYPEEFTPRNPDNYAQFWSDKVPAASSD